MIRTVLLLAMLVGSLALTACGQMALSYQPTMKNLEALRTSSMAPVNVGKFSIAPDKPVSMDQSVTARATTVVSPHNNSFALFLKDALIQELQASNKYDANSTIVVNGLLTKSALDASVGTGRGTLAASFSVTRDGKPVYNKELEEKAEWPSAFIGADAIPTAINEYTSLYKKLLGKLFGDSDFRQATQVK
ncbi:hypothetical protein [Rhodoferax sp.]|uniref:hypothetical protein n=1 Tax=Rhodoferax sp. TaxID=50421 RepID=UPI001ED49E32|nr:hypothetical protein [Rhodoferax sp.]MBT9506227.1 hypothetical protein [Rhodoferax sp.]